MEHGFGPVAVEVADECGIVSGGVDGIRRHPARGRQAASVAARTQVRRRGSEAASEAWMSFLGDLSKPSKILRSCHVMDHHHCEKRIALFFVCLLMAWRSLVFPSCPSVNWRSGEPINQRMGGLTWTSTSTRGKWRTSVPAMIAACTFSPSTVSCTSPSAATKESTANLLRWLLLFAHVFANRSRAGCSHIAEFRIVIYKFRAAGCNHADCDWIVLRAWRLLGFSPERGS